MQSWYLPPGQSVSRHLWLLFLPALLIRVVILVAGIIASFRQFKVLQYRRPDSKSNCIRFIISKRQPLNIQVPAMEVAVYAERSSAAQSSSPEIVVSGILHFPFFRNTYVTAYLHG